MRESEHEPHVVFLPSFYPNRDDPTRGTFFKDQAQALMRAGARVGVLYPHLAPMRYVGARWFGRLAFRSEEAEEAGVPTLRVHGANPPRAPRLSMHLHLQQWARLMRAYVRRHGVPDLIHAHTAVWGGEAARRLSREYAIPYLLTEHSTRFELGLIPPWQLTRLRATFAEAARTLAVSRRLARTLEERFDLERVEVVPNVVDTDLITMPPRPRPGERFRFLSLGFLTARKGMDLLIEAFAAAFRGRDDVELRIGGDGEERGRLERLAEELRVDRQVRFLGGLSREGVRDALADADCFVLASRAETFGVIYVEALASGIPVIATRCGGPEEFVTPDTGLLIEPNAHDELVQALTDMRERARSFDAHRLRAYATSRFGPEAVAERLLGSYREVLAEARSPLASSGGKRGAGTAQ